MAEHDMLLKRVAGWEQLPGERRPIAASVATSEIISMAHDLAALRARAERAERRAERYEASLTRIRACADGQSVDGPWLRTLIDAALSAAEEYGS